MTAPTRSVTLDGGTLHVFDGLFPPERVDRFAAVVAALPFARGPSFDGELHYVIDRDRFVAAPFLHPVTARLIEAHCDAMSARPTAALSHVYAAAIGPGAQTTVHRDAPCPDCLTFLYFANPTWDVDWGGETLFYDGTGDTVACCLPRPGRLLLFNGGLRHRAGVPQRDTPSFRYTVSVFYGCDAHRLEQTPALTPPTAG